MIMHNINVHLIEPEAHCLHSLLSCAQDMLLELVTSYLQRV